MDPFSGVVGAAVAGLLTAMGWFVKSILPKYVMTKQQEQARQFDRMSEKDIKIIDIYAESIKNFPTAFSDFQKEILERMDKNKDEIVAEIRTNEYKELLERVTKLEEKK